jgi:hypothetical protein
MVPIIASRKARPDVEENCRFGAAQAFQLDKGPGRLARPARGDALFRRDNVAIGDYPPTPDLQNNADWTTKQVTFDIPAGATQLQIQPGLWGSKGLLEIDDVVVKAYAEGAKIEAAPAADAPWPSASKYFGAVSRCKCKAISAPASA